jgi:hypothetical protein
MSQVHVSSQGGTIRLGLSLPMFLGSLIALFFGIFPGILGVWLYGAWGIVVPEFIKMGHAHASWWSVLILLVALFLPAVPLKVWVKKFVAFTSIAAVPLWMVALAAYYISKEARGVVAALPARPGAEYSVEYAVYGTGLFIIEVWFFAALALVLLSAMGLPLRRFSQEAPEPSRLDLLTNIEFPRRALWVPLLLSAVALLVGWAIVILFHARGLPVAPAALVQLHSHTMFFIIGYLMTLLAIRAVGASDHVFALTYRLGQVALVLLVVGWILFNGLGLHSLVHVVPSVLYFAVLVLGLLALWGRYGLRETGELHFGYVRGTIVFTWILMIALVAVGPVIALGWSTHPDLTVTFKQPEGQPYPGPYPAEYIGTAPVPHTARGLENLHLSPGSWSHVALFWLLALLLFGERIGKVLGTQTLIFLVVTTIPLAPLFNAFGRVGAWLDLPAGIGGMWFAAHPLKFFNLFLLGFVAIAMIRLLRGARPPGTPV